MEKDIMKAVKLTSTNLENIIQRLHKLTLANPNVSELAYAGEVNNGLRCGCKGSCDGGCTSW